MSVDIRNGLVMREFALEEAQRLDAIFPEVYAGVPFEDVLERIGMTIPEFRKCEQAWASQHE
jgi:hypothetical protein